MHSVLSTILFVAAASRVFAADAKPSSAALVSKCYASGQHCFILAEGGISIAETAELTSDDVPSLNDPELSSSDVRLENLLKKISTDPEKQYAALFLEAGTKTYVEWSLASQSSDTHPIALQFASDQPILQTALSSQMGVYYFDKEYYDILPKELLVAPPTYSLLFTVVNASAPSCAANALIFALIPWDDANRQTFVGAAYFSAIPCRTECKPLKLPTQFIRMCPVSAVANDNPEVVTTTQTTTPVLTSTTSLPPSTSTSTEAPTTSMTITTTTTADSATTTTTIAGTSSTTTTSLKPTISLSGASATFDNAQANILQADASEHFEKCWLEGSAELSLETSWNGSQLLVTIPKSELEGNFTLECSSANSSAVMKEQINLAGLRKYVQVINTGITQYSTTSVEKMLTVEFREALPDFIPPLPYCLVQGGRYEATENVNMVTCNLNNFTMVGIFQILIVRSPVLLNATLNYQNVVDLRVRSVEESVPVTALLSNDLQGVSLKSQTPTVVFPVGLIDCAAIFDKIETLGNNCVCVGDGDNIAVRFGHNSTLTANQAIGLLNPSLTIVVAMPENAVYPNFTVAYPTEVMSCIDEVILEVKQVTGNGALSMIFHWSVVNGSEELQQLAAATTDRILRVPRSKFLDRNELVVEGCNVAGRCTSSAPLTVVLVDDSSVFTVSMEGYEPTVPISMSLRLMALPSLHQCNSTINLIDPQYEWHVDGRFVTYDGILRIPAFAYNANQLVNVSLTARYKGAHLFSATDVKTIRYTDLPLGLTLDCSRRQVSEDQSLVIHADAVDPNYKISAIDYQWLCSPVNETTKTQKSSNCDVTGVDWNFKLLTVPADRLKNKQLNFTVVARSHEKTRNASCIVSVVARRLPIVSFTVAAERKHNINDFIRIQALVTSSGSVLNTTWEVMHSEQSGFFNLSTFLPEPTTIVKQIPANSKLVVSLTIPPASTISEWTGLLSGQRYVIRLWATNDVGTAFADLPLLTNAPPQLGTVEVIANRPIIALQTPVTMSVGDGWTDEVEDLPLSFRFGLRILYANRTSIDYWFPRSTAKVHQLYLPAAFNTSNAPCGERQGFVSLITVCDRLDLCTVGESAPFEVLHPENVTVAVTDIVTLFNSDLANGNEFAALGKLYAIDLELCRMNMDVGTADRVTMMLLNSVTESSENVDYEEVLQAASKMVDIVSGDVVEKLIWTLSEYRLRTGHTQPAAETRAKRSADASDVSTFRGTEEEASEMLNVCDIILGKDQQVIDVYMLNIADFLASFCLQLDAESQRIMKATGGTYTSIQSQSVNCNAEDWNSTYQISGQRNEALTFPPSFSSYFGTWQCGVASSYCRYVCLATASISQLALIDNHFLANYFFASPYLSLSTNRSASNLYQISLIDPVAGTPVVASKNQLQYSVSIPVIGYKAVNYYDCFLFTPSAGWDSTHCLSSSFATTRNNGDFMQCNCSAAGILGIFTVSPPTPTQLPDHNEILLIFTLVAGRMLTPTQIQSIPTRLSTMADVDPRRLVNVTSKSDATGANSTVYLTLRPPFKPTHNSNSYTVQAIQKAISSPQTGDNFFISNFTYQVVKRNLNGDLNARKLITRFQRNYQANLGNNSDAIAKRWALSLTSMLRISEYRIKNAKIFMGIMFNYTITVPFEEEKSPLFAEEISLMIQENSKYEEIELISDQGENMLTYPIQDADIVQLVVIHESNTLVLVIIVVLSAVLGIATLFIGGAIVVKIRTDRLIEEERSRAVLVDAFMVAPPPPEYGNAANFAPMTIGEQYPHRRGRIDARHY